MSGIVGIVRRDGGPVDPAALGGMLDTISHRGPDKSAMWSQGMVGLGNCLLWTTPESLYEDLPLRHPVAPLVIVADARLDNRDELFESLGKFPGSPADAITDS